MDQLNSIKKAEVTWRPKIIVAVGAETKLRQYKQKLKCLKKVTKGFLKE